MSKQAIQLSDHFTVSRLLRFVVPCIGTMLFTSIYGIVDGLCVSNFVGKTAFAAVNLIMPLPMLIGTVGFMLGTGGSAIVAITLGEGDKKRADSYFSLFLTVALAVGAGVTNMVLDVVLVGLLGWSVEGAAIATFISQIVGGVLPVFYFLNRNNTSRLHLKRPHRRLPLRRPEPQ